MTTDSQNVTEFPIDHVPAPVLQPTRPFYWSVRREVWENRSLYLAPLIVTTLVFFATMMNSILLPRTLNRLPLDPVARHNVLVKPFSIAPAPIMLTCFIVGFFYALDALYGERRDRSILFWKSLPVSDRTSVLAKASIPLVVLPLFAYALSLIVTTILLFVSTSTMIASGFNPAILWREYRVMQEPVIMIYGLTVHALWFAPVYCWFLLISAWAKRTPFLWAFLPVFVIGMLERMAFGSDYFGRFIKNRFAGAMTVAFQHNPKIMLDSVSHLTPIRFLTTPALWCGLILSVFFLSAAIRLRRKREPI
ncbi:MAG TPA: ABC transporter permease [Thermoanaerobaculia bacterium]|nr:ABC transporter permease [Thermoanaerobaculia bacterium]